MVRNDKCGLMACAIVGVGALAAQAQTDCFVGVETSMPIGPVNNSSNDQGAYDRQRNVFVVGRGRVPSSTLGFTMFETWEFDGSVWQQVNTNNAIGALEESPFAYDSRRNRILMFGGLRYGPCCNGGVGPISMSNELWEYDATDWTRVLSMQNTPPARYGHTLAYDPVRQVVVMHGGFLSMPSTSPSDCNETWEYNPATQAWTIRGNSALGARASNMVYSQSTQQMVVVSHAGPGTLPRACIYSPASGLWTFGASVPMPSVPNSLVTDMALAYDSNRQQLILAGGRGAFSQYIDVYHWAGAGWNPVLDDPAPPPVRFHHAVIRGACDYDPLRRRFINAGPLYNVSGQFGVSTIWDGLPGIISQPSSPSGRCTGQDIALAVLAYNAETYQWRKGGSPIPGAVFSTFLRSAVTPDDSGTYDCVLTTRCGSVTTNPVPISVGTAPVFTAPSFWSSSCVTCPGSVLTVIPAQVQDPRNQAIALQWRANSADPWIAVDVVQPGGLFMLTSLRRIDAGDYRVVFVSGCGQFVESVRRIEVGVAFDTQPMPQNVAPCGSAVFTVQARGTCVQSYQWLKNGEPIPADPRISGAATPTLTISGCRYEDEGAYACRVRDMCETRDSLPADLALTTPTWTQVPMNAAPPIAGSAEYWTSAYDERRGVAVLYGGLTSSGQDSNSLWEYDGFTWSVRQSGYPAVNTSSGQFLYDGAFAPSVSASAMLYNPDDDRTYLIASLSANHPLAICTWDGSTWARPYYGPLTGDTSRTHAVYDRANRRIVIVRAVGGTANSEMLIYDPATGAMTGPTLLQPQAQIGTYDSQFWFDERRGAVVCYNYLNSFVAPSMWALGANNQWSVLGSAPPVFPSWTPMVFDPVRFQAVAMGGQISSGSYFAATWCWPGLTTKPWATAMPPASDWTAVLPDGPPRNPAGAGISPGNEWRPAFWSGMVFDRKRRAMVAAGRAVNSTTPPYFFWRTYERRYRDRVVFDKATVPEAQPGNIIRMEAYAAGAGSLSYQWRRNGAAIADGPAPGGSIYAGAASRVLTISNVSAAFDGSFTCSVANLCGGAVSATASVGCAADFNHVGGLSVQDIFDFLTAWFSNDSRADFNGVGGVTVQDVFDFLTAWFTGC